MEINIDGIVENQSWERLNLINLKPYTSMSSGGFTTIAKNPSSGGSEVVLEILYKGHRGRTISVVSACRQNLIEITRTIACYIDTYGESLEEEGSSASDTNIFLICCAEKYCDDETQAQFQSDMGDDLSPLSPMGDKFHPAILPDLLDHCRKIRRCLQRTTQPEPSGFGSLCFKFDYKLH